MGLTIGSDADTGKQPRRSQRLTGTLEPPQPPVLEKVEMDREGRVVYVDLEPGGEDRMLQALRDHLSAAQPTPHMLERLPLINRNRVLVEVEDRVALDLFLAWLLGSALKGPMGEALGSLFSPLDKRILLLGAHFICPRVTAVEPRILPQTPHTDVDTCQQRNMPTVKRVERARARKTPVQAAVATAPKWLCRTLVLLSMTSVVIANLNEEGPSSPPSTSSPPIRPRSQPAPSHISGSHCGSGPRSGPKSGSGPQSCSQSSSGAKCVSLGPGPPL